MDLVGRLSWLFAKPNADNGSPRGCKDVLWRPEGDCFTSTCLTEMNKHVNDSILLIYLKCQSYIKAKIVCTLLIFLSQLLY